ncbi:hypothetical protein [Rheinheimera pacifica]|uniref:hypothetical protein n=1 Tax=Rheinheimera pacifica TaxID=173990 RepID=UPI002ED946BF
MVKRLILPISLLLLSVFVMAEPVSPSEKHYRQAAWAFYQQQPATALEALQLAPQQNGRTRLLEAGLYLQLAMPQHAATALEQVLAQPADDNAVPKALKNIALLQFARYQLELGNKTAARQYLEQVNITADGAWRGQQQLLSQLIHWPDISVPPQPDFVSLADQPEMPYVISNQALVLAKQQPQQALNWLARLQQQFVTPAEQGFWQQLFSGRWSLFSRPDGFVYPDDEKQALDDYLQLTQAQLHIQLQDYAAADAILANFGRDSVLSSNALELYSYILTEQRHIPALLAVLQQQIRQQPFSSTAWQAATRIGEQLERALQPDDALAAYNWADNYYQQQYQLINQQANPLQVQQVVQGASQWQQLQLTNDNNLYRLQQDIIALQQQLTAAPERQQRLTSLQQTAEFKLNQQQQLLSSQLPQLSARRQQLQGEFAAIQQQISALTDNSLPQALTQGKLHQQVSRLQRAEQHLQQLPPAQADTYSRRLTRLRGLLQWQYYEDNAAQQYRLNRLQQQISTALTELDSRLQALRQQGTQTDRLRRQQQRLTELSAQQQQLNLALLSQQQQLLAQLNQRLQQHRQQDIARLQQLQRHNKESLARVMELVLLKRAANSGGQP